MSKFTNKYQLAYFQEGDFTSGVLEMQRWETLDAQLSGLFSVMGNGVIDGWDLAAYSGLSLSITPGSGHVAFVSVASTDMRILALNADSWNYIYAILDPTSYWTKKVNFAAFVSPLTRDNALFIGKVQTDLNGVLTGTFDTSGRTELGFIGLIKSLVAEHRHIGGTDNPSPIDLSSEVQGVLGLDNIPDLDTSKIQTGIVDTDRLPLIDHKTKLTGVGSLTHAQLDSIVEQVSIANQKLMGEVSTTNLLQLILALKHVYPDIDEFLVNEIAFIPGISPDDHIDTVNTTAIVDTRTYMEGGQHTITGTPSAGTKSYTKIWDSEDDFLEGTTSNVYIIGDSVVLSTKENTSIIEDFPLPIINGWELITQDNSLLPSNIDLDTTSFVIPPASGKLTVGAEILETQLLIKKTFSAQDWSLYKYLKFYIKTESIEHGDLFFYFKDAFFGAQNSYTKILNRNAPTINLDTLENGWQEVLIDLSIFSNIKNVNEIGFYVSTNYGWDVSKAFDLNVDEIVLTSGNIYNNDGYIRFIYGNNFLYNFWKVSWDAIVPTDSESTGVYLQVRCREANTLLALSSAAWTPYTSTIGEDIPITGTYQYIEIEFYFTASESKTRSVTLKNATLYFYTSSIDNSFEYSTKTDWEAGTRINIDTTTIPNSMLVAGTEEIEDTSYGTEGAIVNLDSTYTETYRITGTMLPRSTYQILNNYAASIGTITGISRSNMGSFWICDTDNDRVFEIDKSGEILRGFFGSYLVENTLENINLSSTTTTTTLVATPANLLQAVYNKNKGYLYLIFDRDLTDSEMFSMISPRIKTGPNVSYLNGASFSKVMVGFDHVVKVSINGAELTTLNKLVYPSIPSVFISMPYQNQFLSNGNVSLKFIISDFELGTVSGENYLRVTIDNATIYDVFSDSLFITGLSNGIHNLKAQLYNGDGSPNTNIEAISEENFVVQTGIYTSPYILTPYPRGNQRYSSSPVQIEFSVKNFPIIPGDQHISYSIDGDTEINYYSTDSILIDGLTNGKHSITIYLVDKNGNHLTTYDYNSATINFIVGVNSNASSTFYCTLNSKALLVPIVFSNMIFSDVYAPFDVQYIPFEISTKNSSGEESILIGKLTNNNVLNKLGV